MNWLLLLLLYAIFANKALNFDSLHTTYITMKVVTIAINAAMKRSMPTMKLSMNNANLELILASSIPLGLVSL